MNRFIHLPAGEKIDSRKYAVIQKLKAAPDIDRAVRITERTGRKQSRTF